MTPPIDPSPPTVSPPTGPEPGGPLLAYVRGFADALSELGVVMGSKVAADLVAGAEAVVATADQPRAARLLPLAADPWPGEPDAVTDALRVSWESPARALAGGVFGLCGCSFADAIAEDLRELLLAHASAGAPLTELPVLAGGGEGGIRYQELLLHLLTGAGLLEHGSSVWGSWRTELGDRWAEVLR